MFYYNQHKLLIE